jgi:hypothetical protein
MRCPTCGTEIQRPDQRYCHACGAQLASASGRPPSPAGTGRAIVPLEKAHGTSPVPEPGQGIRLVTPAPHELLARVMPATWQNRLIVGGVTAIVAIFALWMLVNWIVDTMIHVVLPVGVLLAVIYVGFRYLQSRRSA